MLSKYTVIKPEKDNDINGTIHQYGNGFVKANSKSNRFVVYGYGNDNPLNTSSTKNWVSDNNENEWYSVSFISKSLFISHYSIQVQDIGCQSCCRRFPNKWDFEGKDLKNNWVLLESVDGGGFNNLSNSQTITRKIESSNIFKEFRT